MRTRNADTPKSAPATGTPKKTPLEKKSAPRTPRKPIEPAPAITNSSGANRASATTPNSFTDSTPEIAGEEAKPGDDAAHVTPQTKTVSGTKTTRRVVKRTVKKTVTSAGAVSGKSPKAGEAGTAKFEEDRMMELLEGSKNAESEMKEEPVLAEVKESSKKDILEDVQESSNRDIAEADEEVLKNGILADVGARAKKAGPFSSDIGTISKEEGVASRECEFSRKVDAIVGDDEVLTDVPNPYIENVKSSAQSDGSSLIVDRKFLVNSGPSIVKDKDKLKEELKGAIEYYKEDEIEPDDVEEEEELTIEEDPEEEDVDNGYDQMEDESNQKIHGDVSSEPFVDESNQKIPREISSESFVDNNLQDHDEEAGVLEEERVELTAAAKDRKIRKELEIFVGGLDRDATEEDLKKAFENIGEVVEVRLHKDLSTNKNKGYAFVKFATKEQASRALSEMKNPVIHGKRCGTAPSEDNDTLFLGNICNTWTKEAIKQKLKDYRVDGVERITLVPDAQHEGLSRGFAFIEFSCHAEAMLAYKRLQKPDAIFGHPDRTAKVAFAEPLRDPDPEVLAQVKSVFVDGLPPHWDEDRVRDYFKCYGEITRIMLARNMSTAKRKDFGFVDFSTHEAAIACIDGINNKELGEGSSKTKLKARLSNPLPKTQAVKGGMCGGFRLGRGSAGNFSNYGRGFGRGGHSFDRANFQRGRGFYQRGRAPIGRTGYASEHDFGGHRPYFRGRPSFGPGGRWGPSRNAHQGSDGGIVSARTNSDTYRHGVSDRDPRRSVPFRRQSFVQEEFERPFPGSHFNDPFYYDDSPHGFKRPLYMTDQDPEFMEPSRLRPRLDYSDPAVPFRGSHYRDNFGPGSGMYSHDYYGSDYGGGAYSSFYSGDRSYRGGRYY